MPATGLLALLDDIATMSKVAAVKTAGISGDDLAVNSQALVGVDPRRELPIVWEVAKGSLRNKALLIPAALGLSLLAPWAIMPALTLGGVYLCYEGIEKVLHRDHGGALPEEKPGEDRAANERSKIKGAIRTDLILSAEIVVVTLGAVASSPFLTQLGVLAAVGIGMTAGIYGLVGGLVKLDDLGAWLAKREGDSTFKKVTRGIGKALGKSVPPLMKTISVLGTGAMFMVGGGLILHGIPAAAHLLETAGHAVSAVPAVAAIVEMAAATLVGAVAGLAAMPVIEHLEKPLSQLGGKIRNLFKKAPPATGVNDNAPAVPAVESPETALKNAASLSAAMARANKSLQSAKAALDHTPPDVKKSALKSPKP